MLFKQWLMSVKAMLRVGFLFSVKYKKLRFGMRFFDLNILNARGILAQKYIISTLFFVNFLTRKMRDDPNNQVLWVSWLLVNLNPLELAVLRKAYLTF